MASGKRFESTNGNVPAAHATQEAIDPADFKLDPEFASLIPLLAQSELALLEASLHRDGLQQPLIIWQETGILLDGHNRLALCQKLGIALRIKGLSFPDREAARVFIIHNQLARRNVTPEAASYLRGKRYLAEKLSRGGDRSTSRASGQSDHLKTEKLSRGGDGSSSGASGQSDHLKTAERIAQELKVGEKTIRRDGLFAVAVDRIGKNCGEQAKRWVLSGDSRLRRAGVLRVSKLAPTDQKKCIEELIAGVKRQVPVSQPKGKSRIVLPREPKALADKLVEQLGTKGAAAVVKAVEQLLRRKKRR